MTALLLSQLPWVAALVFVIHNHRAHDGERQAALVAERAEWHRMERELLNRIQAPEQAAKVAEMELQQPDLENPPFVGWDDDEAFHEAKGVTSGAA